MWKYGPPWLLSESHWPHWKPSQVLPLNISQPLEEETPTSDSVPTQPPEEKTGIHRVIDASKYSTLPMSYAFSDECANLNQSMWDLYLPKNEHLALHKWIKTCQALTYPDETANLTCRSRTRLPLVRQLRIFLDSDGFLRCGGRIHNAPLDDSAKFPFLLPPSHPLTKLIIHDAHVKQLHSGVHATLTALRRTFWITSTR